MSAELGPIWRSIRRHRAFALLVLEVSMGFFIVTNLLVTMRWFASLELPPSGHRETDVVEVAVRAPAPGPGRPARPSLGEATAAALAAIPGVQRVAAVSSSQVDDRWALPAVFWGDDTARRGFAATPEVVARETVNGCADAERSAEGVVAGWPVEADAALAETVDLRFIEGASGAIEGASGAIEGASGAIEGAPEGAGSVIITRCLRDAIFGGTPVRGQLLHSNRHPPAPIAGVVEDVRMRVPFLFQTQLTAIYRLPAGDERSARFLVRTAPGRADEVRAAAAAIIARGAGGAPDPDRVVSARRFSLAGTRSSLTSSGTVLLLGVVGLSLGMVAVLGNLAVAAFLVGDRRRVIGLRWALGATRWDILRYLLLENLIATQIGNGLGLAVTLLFLPGAQRRFAGLHLAITDVLAAVVLLSLGGALAKIIPAWRATLIPPSEVSRAL